MNQFGMSNIPSIVEGEASESDGEDANHEHKVTYVRKYDPNIPHGVIVAGEAPESDEEIIDSEFNIRVKKQPQTENISLPTTLQNEIAKDTTIIRDSLLQRKLVECNASLRNNIVALLRSTIQNSLEQLTETEKLLVNSQMRVQRVSGSIKAFSSNSALIASKLSQSSLYIPHVHIPDEDV